MNFFRTCDINNDIINSYSISNQDLELFYDFMSLEPIFKIYASASRETIIENTPYIVATWFRFLQQRKPSSVSKDEIYGGTIYRATFGSEYNLEQIAKNPIYYSKGSNGSGLYAVADTTFGKSYLKNHLTKRIYPFEDKVGNILKIDINDNSLVLSKIHLMYARERFIEEIKMANIPEIQKKAFIYFLKTDISITALLIGADMMFMPNGHVVVLNKKSLILPHSAEGLKNQTLQVDLEKFRARDTQEYLKVNAFLEQ
ncbi:MAG: hypothetical protein IJA23_04630 [Clostridia bacterium]|nr:hypothetical protein [Clostridia bacterium]